MQKPPADPDIARASALAVEVHSLVGSLKRRLRGQGGSHDLPPSQAAVLVRLDRDGSATVTALARAEGVRPQSMGATVAALQAAGLVAGEPDPADGRQTLLSLTPVCREWIKDGRAAREDWLFRAIRAKLSPREQDELARAVELLKRLADA